MCRHLRAALSAACAVLLNLACVSPPLTVHIPPRVPGTASGQLRAGAARVDLTPIPGIPLGGYSVAGKVSRGFWTRLHARAVYIEDAAGMPLVLVSCDLMIMPNGLSDRVAELVSTEPSLRHIGRENLIIAATETHQGPGNHFTSRMYNEFSSPRAGFDPELFEFLAQRIKQAIQEAAGAAMPATLSVNHAGDADPIDNRLSQFFRNRSFRAFLLNPEASTLVSGNSDLPDCDLPFADPSECRAVNPQVEMLRFTDAGGSNQPIAVAVFLAAHTTVLTSETEVFSSDLFGVAATLVEAGQVPGCTTPSPVVALFNGAQGDVTTTWIERDRADVLRLGKLLAAKICALQPGIAQSGVNVAFQYGVEKLSARDFQDASDRPANFQRVTAVTPETGTAELGGAEDGRTVFHEAGLQEGVRNYMRRDHGMKLPPGEVELVGEDVSVAGLAFGMSPPPTQVPIGVYRIGEVAIATIPGEATTLMGERVRRIISAQMGNPKPTRVLLVGFGNGHISYLTTPEEYDLQHYEGASNYYGPATAPFIAHQLGGLAALLPATSTAPSARNSSYDVGERKVFTAKDVGQPAYFVDDGLAAIVQDPATHDPKRDFPTFCWYDALPGLKGLAEGTSDCVRSMPDVSIREQGASATLSVGGTLQDNDGLDIVTVLASFEKSRAEWCAIWLLPAGVDPAKSYQFQVERIRGVSVVSGAFSPSGGTFLSRPGPGPLDPDAGLGCSSLAAQLGLCTNTCKDVPPL